MTEAGLSNQIKTRRRTRRRRRSRGGQSTQWFAEYRIIWAVGMAAFFLTLEKAHSNRLYSLIPLSIILLALYKKHYPTKWLIDDNPDVEQSHSPESKTQSDTPSTELKNALGSEADELLQVEGRLLDQLATLGVAGPALTDTARKFSLTRSRLIQPRSARRKAGSPRPGTGLSG